MEKRRKTNTSTDVKRRYNEKAYDQLNISLPKGMRDAFRQAARMDGTTANALVTGWAKEYLEGKRVSGNGQ